MTYSLSHTIPWVNGGTRHDAMVYLFDTALAGRTNTVVSAHPDGAEYKRSVKRTVANSWISNAPHDMYYWAEWGNTTAPTTCNLYLDQSYTSVPGDLGTNTENRLFMGLNISGDNPSSGDFQFWLSDANDGVLMTQNRTVMFWDPGIDEGMFYPDLLWDGTNDNRSSMYYPFTASSISMRYPGGYPVNDTITGTAMNMNILINHNLANSRPTGYGEIIAGPPVSYHDASNRYYPGVSEAFAFFLPQDCAYIYPSSSNSSTRAWGPGDSAGEMSVIFNSSSSKYYLCFSTSGIAVDCGLTEPAIT